jgi:MoaE-MoaD fusion protein
LRCELRLLGGLTERAGSSRIAVDVPEGTTVAGLRAAVADQHPALAPLLGRVKIAVDLEVAGESDPVPSGAELALLPPVAAGAGPVPEAGGLPDVRVTSDGRRTLTGLLAPPLDPAAAATAVGGPEVGGTVTFLGSVRDHAPDLDEPVVRLEYSAYPAMAQRVLADIADQLLAEHPPLRGIALLHAVGELDVGGHTVLVVCAAAHRGDAFAACREALERVKDHVPVFKREITASGSHRWVGLDACGPA